MPSFPTYCLSLPHACLCIYRFVDHFSHNYIPNRDWWIHYSICKEGGGVKKGKKAWKRMVLAFASVLRLSAFSITTYLSILNIWQQKLCSTTIPNRDPLPSCACKKLEKKKGGIFISLSGFVTLPDFFNSEERYSWGRKKKGSGTVLQLRRFFKLFSWV